MSNESYAKVTGIGAPKLARGVHTVFGEVKENPNTWYVQFSKRVAKMCRTVYETEGQFMIAYERGKAKMKTTPKENDIVRILSEKNIIYKGVVVGILDKSADLGISYVLLLEKIEPVYIGKYFRRNWNLIIED